MLVITGAGRCGTSVLTKFCSNIGYDVNSNDWFNSINAGMESGCTVRINELIVDKKKIPDYLKLCASSMGNEVIKDPRFVLYHNCVPYWYDMIRKDLKYLVLIRKSEHIIASMNSNLNEKYSRKYIEDSYKQFEKNCDERNIQREYGLEFPYFLEDYDLVYKKLTDFGGLDIGYERGKSEWNSLIDFNKIHYR